MYIIAQCAINLPRRFYPKPIQLLPNLIVFPYQGRIRFCALILNFDEK